MQSFRTRICELYYIISWSGVFSAKDLIDWGRESAHNRQIAGQYLFLFQSAEDALARNNALWRCKFFFNQSYSGIHIPPAKRVLRVRKRVPFELGMRKTGTHLKFRNFVVISTATNITIASICCFYWPTLALTETASTIPLKVCWVIYDKLWKTVYYGRISTESHKTTKTCCSCAARLLGPTGIEPKYHVHTIIRRITRWESRRRSLKKNEWIRECS